MNAVKLELMSPDYCKLAAGNVGKYEASPARSETLQRGRRRAKVRPTCVQSFGVELEAVGVTRLQRLCSSVVGSCERHPFGGDLGDDLGSRALC